MQVAVTATQLAMPYLACMTVASLLSGVLNTGGRFALSAGVVEFGVARGRRVVNILAG
jgi:putative peptidoglycan lipid II flippase